MTKSIPMLNLARLHRPLVEDLTAAFHESLRTSNFVEGEAVNAFESKLAKYLGVKHACGVSSGTDALLVSMMALGVKPGDEVITTPYSFFATAGSISRLGARPVFVDIEPDTFNIRPDRVEGALTQRTVGIIPVHLFGHSADMDPLLEIGTSNEPWVLEDAAQAIGAEYDGRFVGTMGKAGIYSFFPAKNLGALGDGGIVVTNDSEFATKVRELCRHGSQLKNEHQMVGGNFRLDALQAAFLSVKLPHLAEWQAGRRRVAARYKKAFKGLHDIHLPTERRNCRHVYNQYVLRSKKRDELKQSLNREGIAFAVYYEVPLHLQPCFASLGLGPGTFVRSERASKECLALPVDPTLTGEEQNRIIETVKESLP